ncbi:MAG: protein adenylyltransferase SelO family protein, partial [Halorubrum sp.]
MRFRFVERLGLADAVTVANAAVGFLAAVAATVDLELAARLVLLAAVAGRQGELIGRWLLVGFIHGVMNTDNMALSGETIDYGPCAFMDSYHPGTVYSSIDAYGRYAYDRQPSIGMWNL